MDQIKIGKFISQCRKEKGLTQQEMADRLGLTAKAVSKWECGKGLPDIAVFEPLCEMLGISLNELFAGEHIENNRIMEQAEENLGDILKDYYAMKRRKYTLTWILIGLLIGIVVHIVLRWSVFGIILGYEFFGTETQVQNDINKYSKEYYFQTYGGDLDSTLLVFPDEIQADMEVIDFRSSLSTGLFDTDGYIILDYKLSEEKFEKEIERLSELALTIENYDGQTYKNEVIYVEGEYVYPAYVTMDGFDSAFEYALIDEENNRIICIHLAYVDVEEFPYSEYLKKDKSCYDDINMIDKYSIYVHSFDNGDTYMEYEEYE